MQNPKDSALYAPLVQHDAQSSSDALDADTEQLTLSALIIWDVLRAEMNEYMHSNRANGYRDDDSRNGRPDASSAKKFSQRRLIISLAPFTVIMALGFIILAGLLGVWVTRTKPNENVVPHTPLEQIALRNNSDLGYDHMNIDDCYSEKKRSPEGDIVANKERFPSGMNALTDQIHSLGLDIKLFQDWGFDLLKYDNCAVPFDEIIKEGMVGKFTRMSEAIIRLSKSSGKPPFLFSLCQWGRNQPWIWARKLGQSWRVNPEWKSLASILNENSFIATATDFYGRNDMDILFFFVPRRGNGDLTYEEQKSHFTAWALMKSPLLILATVTEQTLSILKNTEIIAINQDPVVGTSITPFRWGINPDWTFNATHPAQYWSGDSQNGTVFMLLNTLDHPADMTFRLTESPWIRAGRQYSVRDLWTHTQNGTAVRNFTAHNVPPHGVVALLLKDDGDEPAGTLPECAMLDWCTDQNGTRVDGRD
ncbi:putative alpha-galactosidase B [Psilocybe cubensis]|uniref:Alpha-galactosidase B n=1 Tax=Psilocybe cubensis TaxID=181762 RepID=A0ACB8GSQ8_PSICU|nr:putative alpha-galactosidase B [Psilocybe cubensis]KAH9478773.1 putative alpha-galactosidase B [Psilocybe cubensis]